MRNYTLGLTVAGIAVLLLTACGGGGGGSGSSSSSSSGGTANTAPIANAGANQTANSGVTVTLNGTASSDADGTIAGYAWSQTAGTPIVTLVNGTTAQPAFVAPSVSATATFTFSLVVTDNRGATSAGASVNVIVNPTTNVLPTAYAGASQTKTSGTTVTLDGTASNDPDGSIASYEWTQTAGTPAVPLASATTAQPTFVAPTVATATALTFSLVVTDNRGATSAASTVTVNLTPPVAGNVNVTGKITFARVPFASAPNGLNYAAPVQQPARGVVVEALTPGTPIVLNATITDSVGNYTLVVANNTTIEVRVTARMVRNGIPQWDVRVLDGYPSTNLYSYTEPGSFNSTAATVHNIAIPTGISAAGVATGARDSGPFAILDTIYQGLQTILAAAPETDFPALVVDWGSQNDGTFFTAGGGQHIALLADLSEDTDEFDQHVIAHEFGHYIEHNFSRADNIGGAHAIGDKLDIRVAFGEGFGYAFAAIVLKDPVARDSFVDETPFTRCGAAQCAGQFNIETNPSTGSSDPPCWCSESSVWSLLWDFYDANADANDTLALGFRPLWDVLVGAQKSTPAFTSIFSFASALKAARAADAAAIDTLVAAQDITTAGIDAFAATESHTVSGVPSAATLPLYTDISVGAGPTIVATSNDAGIHNRVGNHRYFRFAPTASGNVNISVSSSNPSNPDPDFRVYRAGTPVLNEEDPPPQPETGTLAVTANTVYVLDVYDCANGCDSVQGTAGDFNLTVTIN